jgi:hypothetical protein
VFVCVGGIIIIGLKCGLQNKLKYGVGLKFLLINKINPKFVKNNHMTLSNEQLQQLEAILLETPFRYAQPILNILQKAAQEQAPKEEVKED